MSQQEQQAAAETREEAREAAEPREEVTEQPQPLAPVVTEMGKAGPPPPPLCPAKLILFCCNLVIGLIGSQLVPEWMATGTYSTWKHVVKAITMCCVSFIMIHVGFHFDLDKSDLKKYGTEYLVAMTAAGFPWLFCAFWFMFALGPHNLPWQEALIAARFAAPTSAGILFTMLEASGMKETWLFKKARILAIFDDLDTLLLMVPLKAIFVGLKWEISIDLVFVSILIFLMYRFLHRLALPATWPAIVGYSICVAFLCELVHFLSSSDLTDPRDLAETVHLEVLLPAFTVGCVIKHQDSDPKITHAMHRNDSLTDMPAPKRKLADRISADTVKSCISAVFMVLVGFSMPSLFNDKHETQAHRRLGGDAPDGPADMAAWEIALHVVACTFLMNAGKLFPAACYRKEVNLRTRIALAVAMMPRGEVCAGIIVNALALGITGPAMTIAVFCLACNMMMVSFFIFVVKKLTGDQSSPSCSDVQAREAQAAAAEPSSCEDVIIASGEATINVQV
jgi:Kef-type K+ transport system membrane component KefB